MKKPARWGRANNTVANSILNPKTLSDRDFNIASFHLELLHKSEKDTEIRAISYRGGGLYPKECKFPEFKANYNLEGRGVYFVVNDGGTTDIEITLCRAFFVEWDNIPVEKQLYIYKELNLPIPTFQVHTGNKSIHNYWVLNKPVSQLIWQPIQKRLTEYCKADRHNVNPSRVMRLAGFYYINDDGKATEKSRLINITQEEYSYKDIEKVLPEPKPEVIEPRQYKKEVGQTNWTLDDVGAALKTIPVRVGGSNTYEDYRQIAWGLKALIKEMGYPESLAIELMEAHSPSGKATAWNVSQVMRSGGERVGAGTFIYYAQKHGWKPKK